jgi:hypothetical protein
VATVSSDAGRPATTPADYGNRSGMLTFAAGSATPQTFTIPIVNDDLFEGDQR